MIEQLHVFVLMTKRGEDLCGMLQLHRVSAVDESGAVTITATLKEKADLYGANGKHADSYDNPYTVEYSVVEDGGHWKIIDALVLGE